MPDRRQDIPPRIVLAIDEDERRDDIAGVVAARTMV